MAYLIHMRATGTAHVMRVLSDRDTLDEALTEGLAAMRERCGITAVAVEGFTREEYAPLGHREFMPDHDLYASGHAVGETPTAGTVQELLDILHGADPALKVRLAFRVGETAVSCPIHAVALPGEFPWDPADEEPRVWLAAGRADGLAPDEAWVPR